MADAWWYDRSSGEREGVEYYAHSLAGRPVEQWEPLDEHLRQVAELAAGFARAFGAEPWGEVAGLWHDLGKYSVEFQRYLREQNGLEAEEASLEGAGQRPRHAIAGARHACGQNKAGILLAYCIAGHHGGLNDTGDLRRRLNGEPVHGMPGVLPQSAQRAFPMMPPHRFSARPACNAFQIGVFARMLFSTLVDADFLATERFMSPERACWRNRRAPDLVVLRDRVAAFIAGKQQGAEDTAVNRRRCEVLAACRSVASLSPGFFSLTVPTGGGKTLSSLMMALDHAVRHDLRRIIYAIPFTSIIEQNADVFRAALGDLDGSLLEHHSSLDPRKETLASRLASENWDAPLIVTTNVQLFESLYAHRPSDCRKLHRVARSVIVLDEAQSVPVKLLEPCLAILRELVNNYGCTVILCTATQPAVARREEFKIGIEGICEVIPDRAELYRAMRRVDAAYIGALADVELIERLRGQRQALCIVNTRAHAAKLYSELAEAPGALHLSALMCPQHRSRVIRLIRARLRMGRPCVVISTQLVEAGVDVDFPVVYRAMAGLDSIAQAAGRCNREGRRARGEVFVFDPECPIPPGEQRIAVDSARDVIPRHPDMLSLEAMQDYFQMHYWRRSADWDKCGVMECFAQGGQLLNFATASGRFRMIQETGRGVVVPYGRRGRWLRQTLLTRAPDALPPGIFRIAQRLTVQIPVWHWDRLCQSGAIGLYGPGESLPLLMDRELYHRKLGLGLEGPAAIEVESLIV